MIRPCSRRWRLRRRVLGLLAVVSLVLSTCVVERPSSAKQDQWRLPPQGEVLAAASAPRQALAVQQRLQLSFAPVLASREAAALRPFRRPVFHPQRRRDGSLPPGRRQYRRAAHDDRSDLPA